MMLAWVIDLLLVSGLLGLSALLLERVVRARHGATRIVWLTAMLASLLLPLLASLGGPPRATSAVVNPELGADGREDHSPRKMSWTRLGPTLTGDANPAKSEALIVWLWASSTALTGS